MNLQISETAQLLVFIWMVFEDFSIKKELLGMISSKWRTRYCNVDDKALLGNDSVKQQLNRSDRCYAMAQYTHVNNGGEHVFYVVGAVVISRV
jgi:hypothetical protein